VICRPITIWRWSVRMLALQPRKFLGETGIQFEVFPWFCKPRGLPVATRKTQKTNAKFGSCGFDAT
jgi:hypothetical protein